MNEHPLLIGLAGPSGSGKSTLMERAQRELGDVELIKLDKFYKDSRDCPPVGRWLNWETPESLHWDELVRVLQELKAGRPVKMPEYSKPLSQRTGSRIAKPAPVILVEGFLLFADARVRELLDRCFYLDVPWEVQVQRRLARQPDVDQEYMRKVVRPMFERYGRAAARHAEAVLDGSRTEAEVWEDFRSRLV